jgi:hypothetical protein
VSSPPEKGSRAAGFLRATIDGRADDGFRYGDLTVHPTVLTTALLQTAALCEYQVRQRPRGVTVAVVADADFDHRALAAGIEDSLRQAGLTDPETSISRVDAITRDPLTGKAKRFVPPRGGARLVRKHDQHAGAATGAGRPGLHSAGIEAAPRGLPMLQASARRVGRKINRALLRISGRPHRYFYQQHALQSQFTP